MADSNQDGEETDQEEDDYHRRDAMSPVIYVQWPTYTLSHPYSHTGPSSGSSHTHTHTPRMSGDPVTLAGAGLELKYMWPASCHQHVFFHVCLAVLFLFLTIVNIARSSSQTV